MVAPTGMAADALATAVSVLGVEAGRRLIEETPGTAALVFRLENGSLAAYRSTCFAQYERRCSPRLLMIPVETATRCITLTRLREVHANRPAARARSLPVSANPVSR